jgi:hypothetical protein
MARRSPMNARYQKNTSPAGKTKRSASAAKPKREAGAQGEAAPKKKAKAKPRLRDAFKPAVPDTPEIKRWAKIRWALLGGAVVAFIFAFFAPIARTDTRFAYGTLFVYLVLLGGSFYVDFAIIRKLREEQKAKVKKKA